MLVKLQVWVEEVEVEVAWYRYVQVQVRVVKL